MAGEPEIVAREVKGSPVINYSVEDGWTGDRGWRIPWGQAGEFLSNKVDSREELAIAGIVENVIAYAQDGTIKPWNLAKMVEEIREDAVYDFARVDIHYRTPSFSEPIETDSKGDFSVQFQPILETTRLSEKNFVWGDNDAPFSPVQSVSPAQAPIARFHQMDIVFTRFNINLTTFQGHLFTFPGRSNSTPVIYKGITFPIGTLLYNNPTVSGASQTNLFNIVYRLSYRPATWNRFYKEDAEDFITIWHKDTTKGKFVFAPADANFLLL